jgi:two-component system, NtrC family, response regulator AtoC
MMRKTDAIRILLVEDDESLGGLLLEELQDVGYQTDLVPTAEKGLSMALAHSYALIVSDLRLPGADGLALLKNVRQALPDTAPDFLMITAFGSVERAVECLKAGAEDFLTKPLDLEHFHLTLRRMLEKRSMRSTIQDLRRVQKEAAAFHGMYGRSAKMLHMFRQVQQIAQADGPVLIHGESGTGKELIARAIHEESKMAGGPFLVVNCAGIPEALLESEFFGHAAGSFTGAQVKRQGIFAEAEGGTLFLDEIGDMPYALQAKVLRMLQDGKIRPVGSNQEQQVQVRIVAATNHDLEERVGAGHFREDLFFRLETFSLQVPPLRERDDDIDLLAALFLQQHALRLDKPIRQISAAATEALRAYRFPGNVRELSNAIERAAVFCAGRELQRKDLPARIRRETASTTNTSAGAGAGEVLMIDDHSLPSLLDVENRYIAHVMERVSGNKRRAADILGIGRRTLYRRLTEMQGSTAPMLADS